MIDGKPYRFVSQQRFKIKLNLKIKLSKNLLFILSFTENTNFPIRVTVLKNHKQMKFIKSLMLNMMKIIIS
jgi:hypothetical protein